MAVDLHRGGVVADEAEGTDAAVPVIRAADTTAVAGDVRADDAVLEGVPSFPPSDEVLIAEGA